MNLLIKSGRVIDPSQNLDAVCDVLIRDGIIAQIGDNLPEDGLKVLWAEGLIVAPGLIDLHVHGRTPGQEYKEDTATLTASAARGGITTVCVMPNTEPAIDRRSIVEDVLQRAKTEGNGVKVLPIASVSVDAENKQLSEFADCKNAGAIAVSDDAFPMQDAGFMRRVFQYAKTCGLVVMLHCEDTALTRSYEAGGGVMNEGVVSNELGLRGCPKVAEELAVFKACSVAGEVGNAIHILHTTTAGAVEQIRQAKAKGVRVTAEVCPHHFALTDEACRDYNTDAKMNPPLRNQSDIDALIEGLKDGTIDCIATDHAPHAAYEKEREFALAPFGIVGLETSLGLSLKHLDGHLSLPQIIEKMSCAPSKVLSLPTGTLQIDAPADITIFDADVTWILNKTQLASKSKNTPFDGYEMRGQVVATIVDGQIIYQREGGD